MSNNQQESETQTRIRCIACKSEIYAGANICPICKSYQSRWKNILYYCASIAGVITVIISLLTYVVANFPDVRKRLFWRDSVEVTAFHSNSRIIIHNSGDGKVFVSHLAWRCEKPHSSHATPINTTVENNSFAVVDISRLIKDTYQWDTFALSEDQWQKVISLGGAERDCFRWTFLHADDPTYQTVRAFFGNRFHSLPCDATLFFNSGLDGHQISKTMTIYAVPYWKRSGLCLGKVFRP